MHTDLFDVKPERWIATGEAVRPTGRPGRRGWVAAAAALVILAVSACAYLAGYRDMGRMRGQVEGLNAQLAAVQRQLSALKAQQSQATPRPACRSAADWLETITGQERAAQWQVAATNAQTALSAPGLCDRDRKVLAGKAVADGLEALFAQRFAPDDLAAQRQSVDRYQGLQRLAQAYDVPFPSARQVAGRAYDVGQFLLAKQAFEEALERGEITMADQAQVQFYYSTLYNLGVWWAETASGATRSEGLRLLAAANQIDRQYRIGNGLAWARLRELVGPDERGWPAPAASPLLDSTK